MSFAMAREYTGPQVHEIALGKSLDAFCRSLPSYDLPAGFVMENHKPTCRDVIVATACLFRVSVRDLTGHDRKRPLVHYRQLAMYVARTHTKASYPQIGLAFGGRDHSTGIHSFKAMATKCSTEASWALRRKMLIDALPHAPVRRLSLPREIDAAVSVSEFLQNCGFTFAALRP